jgi:hypothetical protein
MKNWTEEMEMVLISKTENYSNQEKENIHYEYLKNLIEKIETEKLSIETDLQTKIEYVINEIPNKTNEKRIDYKNLILLKKDITQGDIWLWEFHLECH